MQHAEFRGNRPAGFMVFSSPEPKAQGELIVYRSIRRPSVRPSVRPSSVRPSTFSNDISSKAVRQILYIFHI